MSKLDVEGRCQPTVKKIKSHQTKLTMAQLALAEPRNKRLITCGKSKGIKVEAFAAKILQLMRKQVRLSVSIEDNLTST